LNDIQGTSLATGDFVALGWRIDLSKLHCPMFLLAAREDNIVTSEQILATERLVGHGHCTITKAIALSGLWAYSREECLV
jgi:poly(3-hydroxyalkanoate) synthetase